MPRNHHFISYSTADGPDFADRLHDALEGDEPTIDAWLDKRDTPPGQPWNLYIRDAISNCEMLLFAMTTDSVDDTSGCHNEITQALSYKKPIIPLLVESGVEIPYDLQTRQYIDFTGDFNYALASLRNHFRWMRSPEGILQQLKDRLADTRRDLRRVPDDDPQQHARLEKELSDHNRYDPKILVSDVPAL